MAGEDWLDADRVMTAHLLACSGSKAVALAPAMSPRRSPRAMRLA